MTCMRWIIHFSHDFLSGLVGLTVSPFDALTTLRSILKVFDKSSFCVGALTVSERANPQGAIEPTRWPDIVVLEYPRLNSDSDLSHDQLARYLRLGELRTVSHKGRLVFMQA